MQCSAVQFSEHTLATLVVLESLEGGKGGAAGKDLVSETGLVVVGAGLVVVAVRLLVRVLRFTFNQTNTSRVSTQRFDSIRFHARSTTFLLPGNRSLDRIGHVCVVLTPAEHVGRI